MKRYALAFAVAACLAAPAAAQGNPDKFNRMIEESKRREERDRKENLSQHSARLKAAEACTMRNVIELERAGTPIAQIGTTAVGACRESWRRFARSEAARRGITIAELIITLGNGLEERASEKATVAAAKLRNDRSRAAPTIEPREKGQSI